MRRTAPDRRRCRGSKRGPVQPPTARTNRSISASSVIATCAHDLLQVHALACLVWRLAVLKKAGDVALACDAVTGQERDSVERDIPGTTGAVREGDFVAPHTYQRGKDVMAIGAAIGGFDHCLHRTDLGLPRESAG